MKIAYIQFIALSILLQFFFTFEEALGTALMFSCVTAFFLGHAKEYLKKGVI